MLILTIRTDKPEAEIGLFDDGTKLAYSAWPAHRQLAETIHTRLQELLDSQGKKLEEVRGIAVFKGPGSFTGLRIGISVANALAYGLGVPIVSSTGEQWLAAGLNRIAGGEDEKVAIPEYGALPHVTAPKK